MISFVIFLIIHRYIMTYLTNIYRHKSIKTIKSKNCFLYEKLKCYHLIVISKYYYGVYIEICFSCLLDSRNS